ncbi:MAG: glycosyltransferase [Acidobacteriaceae bacterium]|nr:glycosyltransferase [Acidobacteriaceae bacterium]
MLDRCLAALERIDYPRSDFEVLVIDDGSNIPLTDLIDRHNALLAIRYYRSDAHGPARARNLGLSSARGDYVVFTDDDCIPQPDWLTAFDAAFKSAPDVGFGGRIVDAPENNVYGRASQMLITFLYNGFPRHPDLTFFCSNNLAFPRRRLMELGGFDETFPRAAGEDRELCARWNQRYELRFLPDAVVRHHQLLDFRSFSHQHFRYGVGGAHFWSKKAAAGEAGVKVKSLDFYWRMLTFPFSAEKRLSAFTLSSLLLLSQVANMAGYFAGRIRTGRELRSISH